MLDTPDSEPLTPLSHGTIDHCTGRLKAIRSAAHNAPLASGR